jgi:tRNA-specific 2-thiouridylase
MSRQRIVVGMSGGVDSSVAAALLVEQGYDVVGVTMHLAGGSSRCCSLDDADDARRVAESLGIRFYVANYTEQFRREVMEPFADAYLAGHTPIPCVICNRRFKFHHLLQRARAFGATGVATGHYARLEDDGRGGRRLLRGRDDHKDQSYFLFDLGQEQLAHACFPLGALSKDQVREHARALGLATAEKPESQEICFVPDGDYAAIVESLRPNSLPGEGEVVDGDGRVLGRHAGVHRFTVGQRRGLGLSAPRPLYVTQLDPVTNRVRVGEVDELESSGAWVEGVSWVAGKAPGEGIEASVRVRHRDEARAAKIEIGAGGTAHVRFDHPVRAVTPGQAAVFYQGDTVLGGGWIASALS